MRRRAEKPEPGAAAISQHSERVERSSIVLLHQQRGRVLLLLSISVIFTYFFEYFNQ